MVLCDLKGITQVLTRFYGDLRVWEASGRAPGGSPGTFSKRFGDFVKRFWEVFGGSEWVWNGFRKFSEGFRRFLEDFRSVRGGDL